MAGLFLSGRALDAVLAVVLLELIVLKSTRGGRRWAAAAPDLAMHLWSAAGLLLAAHLVIVRAHWLYAALALSAGGLAHLLGWRAQVLRQRPRALHSDPQFSSRLIS